MKRRRIRMKTGDVFAAPFDEELAKHSDEWSGLWEPKEGEPCFIMQNIGMSRYGAILTMLYDGVYSYSNDLENLDVLGLKPLAIVELISYSMKVGSFKKISNQLIPEDTPYMAYGYEQIEDGARNHYINYETDGVRSSRIAISENVAKYIPSYGVSVTGGYMHWFADYFIKEIKSEYLRDDIIDSVKIRSEALVSNFFPEAEKSPNVAMTLHFGERALVQDRDSYNQI